MNDETITSEMSAALQNLETNLETPIVPGELSSWIHDLCQSRDKVDPLLHKLIEDSHSRRIELISEQDPDQLSRLQRLQEEDQALLDDFYDLAQAMESVAKQIGDEEDNESELIDETNEIVELGLALIIRTRTQEATLTTWYMEAFQRDRGVAD